MGIAKKKGKATPLAWKSMQLGGALISQGIEGLIGIEELTDYSISKKKSPFNKRVQVTKVHIRSKDVKKGSVQDKKSIALPSTEQDTIECNKNRKFKRSQDLLREEKRKEKKREWKLNLKNTNEQKKSEKNTVPSTLLVPVQVEKDTKNKNRSIISTTIKASNKINIRNEKTMPGKKKEKLLKLKEAGTLADQTSLSKNKKRRSSVSLTNEPNSKKQKCDGISHQLVETSKKSKAKLKKSKISQKSKVEQRSKSLTKKCSKPTNTAESDTLENDLGVEKSISSIEGMQSKPILGMEAWSELNLPDSILRALAESGFKKPTEIQACSLPAAVLGRRDIMGAAETGSGKTLAFGIPILYGILQQKKKNSAANSTDDLGNKLLSENEIGEDENEEVEEEDSETAEVSEARHPDNDKKIEDHMSHSDTDGESEEMDTDRGGIGCVNVIDNADFSFMGDCMKNVVDKPVNPKYNQKLYALILTPTRELAMQVKDHIAAAAKYTGIRVTVVIGGLAHQKQERLLKTKPEIVVATPGRLWELIQEGNSFLQQVDDISYLAIDETDRMIEKGHFQELQQLLLRINENAEKKKRRQNFVFSATLTMVHEPPKRKKTSGKKQQMRVTPGQKLQDVIKMLGIKHPKVVDVTQESGTARTLEEAQIRCNFEEKDVYLYYFLVSNPGRTLVFCNSISCVRRLAQILTILQCKPLPIHANMIQRQRLKNLDKFRANPTGLLLATDVAARGLDIPDVEHVVHYQVPRTSEGYIHRSGRTARASKGGLTLLLIEPAEQQSFSRLCRTLGRTNELPAFEVSQGLLSAAKERVHLARDIDRLELTSKKSDAELGWYQKALADMDMVLDKSELPSRISEEDSAKNRRASGVKRKQLDTLLSRPLFTRK